MASADIELMQQLKEGGKRLSHPPASVDELLHLLDQIEKLLSMVDQSPNDSMLEALNPSMKALVEESLLRHSNVDVKVAVASCISEITRITAPDAPYNDEEMKDVFQLIVSSFENLSDKSSRSYNKRVSILETVSKVRSCVVMLDLECDGLIVEMFEHFVKSVRDHHLESIFSSMMNIMVLVLEESEDISVDMLKPLLASIRNNSEGVLPVARKLGEGVLQKSAAKLRPYLIQTLRTLGDSLDNYNQVLASICEGTTAVVEHNDENASALQQADESKLAKESSDEAPQADESKLTTASSDNAAQVVVENAEGPFLGERDPTSHRSPKSVMSNGVMVTGNEEASADQDSSKKPEEAIDHPDSYLTSKVDTPDSVAEKLAMVESKPEETSKRRGKKSDTTTNSAEPSDSSHGNGEKDAEKLLNNESSSKDIRISPGKESSIEAGVPSEIEKNTDILGSVPKAIESEVANAPSSQRHSLGDESCVKMAGLSKKNQVLPQQVHVDAANAAFPSQGGSLPYGSCITKAGRSKKKSLSRDDAPSMDVVLARAPEGTSDSDMKSPKRARKKAPVVQEDKLPAAIATLEDEVTSGSDAKLLKTSSKKVDTVDSGSKSEKQLGKKLGAGDSEAKMPKQSGKKVDAGELEAKKPKRAGKKVDAEGKPSRIPLKKEDESDSDAKPLRQSGNKGEKNGVITKHSGHTTNKGEGSDSENKPLKPSAKKGNTSSSAVVKSSSKKNKDGNKHGHGKNVEEKYQAKSLSEDDGMDISPKSARKSDKGEGNLEEALPTTSKRKRAKGKDKVNESMKLDDSLVGLKVKVWWPKDKMYYEGVIASFDSTKQKHKVSYVDGDVEILNLKKQKWEILKDFSVHDEEKATEVQSVDGLPETHKKKKSRTDLGQSASPEKLKDSAKQAGGASLSGKSKGPASRSARSSKGEGKVDKKSEDSNSKDTGMKSTSQKNGGKSLEAAFSKEAEMSKEDNEEIHKIITKNKQGTQKMVNKSKGKTPESGNKANANGSSKPKSVSLNVKQSEDGDAVDTTESAKGKSAETTKAGSKSRKKRKKRS